LNFLPLILVFRLSVTRFFISFEGPLLGLWLSLCRDLTLELFSICLHSPYILNLDCNQVLIFFSSLLPYSTPSFLFFSHYFVFLIKLSVKMQEGHYYWMHFYFLNFKFYLFFKEIHRISHPFHSCYLHDLLSP